MCYVCTYIRYTYIYTILSYSDTGSNMLWGTLEMFWLNITMKRLLVSTFLRYRKFTVGKYKSIKLIKTVKTVLIPIKQQLQSCYYVLKGLKAGVLRYAWPLFIIKLPGWHLAKSLKVSVNTGEWSINIQNVHKSIRKPY